MATTTRKGTVNPAARPRAIALAVATAFLPWYLPQTTYAQAPDPNTLPTGGQITNGAGQIHAPQGRHLQIDQYTQKMIAEFGSFSIGANASVNLSQPGASSIALFRDVGGDPSKIFGNLTANGQLFISNQNGVLFGASARVDVGALFATSLSITDHDFMAGRYHWYNEGNAGSVVNQGQIVTANGYTALVGPQVRNDGIIIARAGSVALAAGDRVSLDMIGDGLISVSVDQSAYHASVINTGSITADGGTVLLTARSANALLDTVVNNSGTIRANSLVERNGEIVLDGGNAGVVANTGTLTVAGTDRGITGGTVEVLGKYVGLFDGTRIDASGDAGGGTVLIGGNYQGQGPERNASMTYVGRDVSIKANGVTNGNGGQVVVWSDDNTRFYGSIAARGGEQGGDGGGVEVSGGYLAYRGTADTRAPNGQTGWLLLDPTNIYIAANQANATAAGMAGMNTSADTGVGADPTVFQGSGVVQDSLLTTGNLATALTTSRVVVTTANVTGTGLGDIFIVDTVTAPASSFGLTLRADRNISLLANLDFSASTGSVALRAITGSITRTGAASIAMGGGSLVLSAATGVGSLATPILTSGVTGFAAATAAGGIFLTNSSNSTINVTSVTNADLALTVTGVTATLGDIDIRNNGSVTVSEAVNAAAGTVDIRFGQSGGGSTFTLASTGSLSGTTKTVTGGGGNDAFDLTAAPNTTATLDGAGGSDTVQVTRDADFTLQNASLTTTDGMNLTLSSVESAVLTGGAADNNINASAFTAGPVTLDGQGGADTLTGGSGNDTLIGGAGADTLNGGAGDDIYIIASSAHHAAAEIADTGGTADEVRFTSTAGETLAIFASDTGLEIVRISDAAGVTTGTTAESIDASAAPNGLTIIGNDGANSLVGTAFVDTINGNGGADTIIGGAGIDTITGGAGTDVMDGGADDDVYLIASAADHAAAEIADTGVGGADEVRFTSTTAGETLTIFALDTGLESVRISDAAGVTTGTTQLNIDASLAPNGLTITGNDGDNTLVGTTAADTITGNGGNDTITGGASTDVLNGGLGDDIYIIASSAHHAAAEIADTGGTADEVRFTSTAGETLTIFAGDTGLEIVRISDAAGVTTGTTAESIDASAAPNGLTIIGNDGANSLVGTAGIDTITGNGGSDTITGGAGTDILNGGAGDDIYIIASAAHHAAGEIADTGGTADEVRFTSTAGETLTIFAGDSGLEIVRISDAAGVTTGTTAESIDASAAPNGLTIIGNDGANSLVGTAGIDTITGNGGNDTITGGASTDVLNGGLGDDIYIIASFAHHAAAEIADTGGTADEVRFTSTAGETLTIFAGDSGLEIVRISDAAGVTTGTTAESIDASAAPNGLTIIGNDGANGLVGTTGIDTINGNGGADTITGGAGTDILNGGTGDDIYIIASAGDHAAAEIADTAGAADEVRFTSTAGETLTIFAGDTGLEIVRITDAAGVTTGTTAESIDASAASNGLTIIGNDGANSLVGTAFVDTINGNGGADTITGGAGTDILNGGAGDDIYIIASAGDHAAAEIADTAGAADEVRFTSTAAQTLTIFAGDTGLEVVRISDAAGVTIGTTAESIDASAAPNGLTIIGNDGANSLVGTAFVDTINGNGGADTITGGAGTDILNGGAGDDIYIIASAGDHAAAEIADTAGAADEARFTSTAGETLTIFAGDTGLEVVRISDAAGVATGTTAESIDASAAPNALTIHGNDGSNSLVGTAFVDAINGNGGNDTITGGVGADILSGGTGAADTVAETRDANFTITDSALTIGTEGADTLTAIEVANLTGGAGSNTFTLSAWTGSGSIVGGGGTDALVGPDTVNAWTINAANGGNVNGTIIFSAISNFTGGTLNDSFTFTAAGSVSGLIDGGAHTTGDSANYSARGALTVTIGTSITNIESVTGNDTNQTLAMPAGTNTFTISDPNDGNVNGTVTFTDLPNLTGGAGDDTFTFTTGSLTGSIDGGTGTNSINIAAVAGANTINLQAGTVSAVLGGTFTNVTSFAGDNTADTLVGTNANTTWTISGANDGSLSTGQTFTDIASLTGGTLGDTFTLASGTLSGSINGAGGNDTLSGSATYVVTGGNSGTATGVTGGFSNIENLVGTAGADTFTLAGGTLAGTVDGLASTDTLTGGNVANTWTITGPNSGTLTGTGGWSNIENLVGGTGTDSFSGILAGSVGGTISDGGGGATTLSGTINSSGSQTYSAAVSSAGVTLNAGTAAISATNAGNNFTGPLSVSGSSASITDMNALTIGANLTGGLTTTSGALTYVVGTSVGSLNSTASGAVNQSGAVTVTGATNINAGGNAITLTSANDFQGTLSLVGGTTQVRDANALTLGNVSVGALTTINTGALNLGTLNVSSLTATTNGGNITQSGPASVTGATSLQAGSGSIVLALTNDFGGVVAASGIGITLNDVNTLAPGTINAGSGSVNLSANSLGAGGTVSAGAASSFSSNTNVNGLDINMPNVPLALSGAATQWNLTSTSTSIAQPNPVTVTGSNVGVTYNLASIIASVAQQQAASASSSVSATVAAVIVEEANKTFGTDSVAEDVEYGFAGEVGATPPMDHRIDESGISLPRCVQESREGMPCK